MTNPVGTEFWVFSAFIVTILLKRFYKRGRRAMFLTFPAGNKKILLCLLRSFMLHFYVDGRVVLSRRCIKYRVFSARFLASSPLAKSWWHYRLCSKTIYPQQFHALIIVNFAPLRCALSKCPDCRVKWRHCECKCGLAGIFIFPLIFHIHLLLYLLWPQNVWNWNFIRNLSNVALWIKCKIKFPKFHVQFDIYRRERIITAKKFEN